MRIVVILVRWLGYILLYSAAAVVLGSLIMIWVNEGFSAVQEIMNPYNVVNFIATVLVLLPGLGMIKLSEWLDHKTNHPN